LLGSIWGFVNVAEGDKISIAAAVMSLMANYTRLLCLTPFISYLSLSFYVLFISRVLLKNLLSYFFSFFLFFFLSLLGVMVGTGLPVNLRPKRESGLVWNLAWM
jgi:hypothetical protein